MATKIEVQFRLKFVTRHDAEADVHVGYCPALRLYSQARTEKEADRAVVSAAKLFIISCYERDILHTVLRDRGMTTATAENVPNIVADNKKQFIAVGKFDREFEAVVPIHLLAHGAAAACQQ
jgi:hypothetical protein